LTNFWIFDRIKTEMNKILILCAIIGLVPGAPAYSAARDGASNARPADTNARATATPRTVAPQNSTTNARTTRNTTTRAGTLRTDGAPRTATNTRTRVISTETKTTPRRTVQVGRAAIAGTPSGDIMETRTGAEYARCKTAYFQCMDQFCQLKNDDYRRCSCSSRIYDLMSVRQNIIDTNNKLTEFTENLDAVGLTAAQATAMHTASDGENALTADTSASKALLTAIMNSIRGGDTTVGGAMSDLNSINLSFDTVNMFGLTDTAQVIASYNGTELYNAVYPSCRNIVAADCNNASLQRAVTAYLMAIEQDCNTVQTALESKQKDLRAAVRESSAMLDLARIENRSKHNSDNMATCIGNVEAAVLSEEVCGANYHKCLDNGEFIDVTTGAPIAGVARFYELQDLLKFDPNKDNIDQKLAQNPNNNAFVKNFESKTKKFAEPALDKCTEIADTVWSEYLDKALLDIYYAQKAKVQTIKTGCLDLISGCYDERDAAITAAMAELIDGTNEISLLPDKIVLTREMCNNYIESCNNMFDNTNIIAEYIDHQTDTDTTAACRAIVQQCFDSFGGANYENFYYPGSGLFQSGVVDDLVSNHDTPETAKRISALDWFTLYEYDENGERKSGYVSKCAQQVADIPSCADKVELVFGGMDTIIADRGMDGYGQYIYTKPTHSGLDAYGYGWAKLDDGVTTIPWDAPNYKFKNRRLRPTGVATEVYNQIIDNLITQCMNIEGKFIEAQFVDHRRYGIETGIEMCKYHGPSQDLYENYGIFKDYDGNNDPQSPEYREYMCPREYTQNTDTSAWGICSCWENGGRRSKNGLISKCMPLIRVSTKHYYQGSIDSQCTTNTGYGIHPIEQLDRNCSPVTGLLELRVLGIHQCGGWYDIADFTNIDQWYPNNKLAFWCTSTINSGTKQVCPFNLQNPNCTIPDGVPDGITQ
jgi:hypothetical protein